MLLLWLPAKESRSNPKAASQESLPTLMSLIFKAPEKSLQLYIQNRCRIHLFPCLPYHLFSTSVVSALDCISLLAEPSACDCALLFPCNKSLSVNSPPYRLCRSKSQHPYRHCELPSCLSALSTMLLSLQAIAFSFFSHSRNSFIWGQSQVLILILTCRWLPDSDPHVL